MSRGYGYDTDWADRNAAPRPGGNTPDRVQALKDERDGLRTKLGTLSVNLEHARNSVRTFEGAKSDAEERIAAIESVLEREGKG